LPAARHFAGYPADRAERTGVRGHPGVLRDVALSENQVTARRPAG